MLRIIRDRWKVIAAGGVLGSLVGACYLALQSTVFQATVMISMAQVPSHRDYSQFANIEEPVFLIERLKIPSTYTTQVISACKNSSEDMQPESMERLISASIPRAVGSVAIIRIRRGSPDISKRCANALYEMIRKQQENLARPIEEDLKRSLNSLQKRQAELISDLARAEKQGRYETLFFAKRDELIGLNQKIFDLDRGIQKIAPASLMAPVYVNPNPISPQRALILTSATLAGLFFGLIVAGFREFMRAYVDSSGNQA
jgi:hypothetical protein